jgi:hypothetical protein
MKGFEHPFDVLGSLCWSLHTKSRRQSSPDLASALPYLPVAMQTDVETIEKPRPINGELGCGNIHHCQMTVQHTSRAFILQQAMDGKRLNSVPDREAYCVTPCEAPGACILFGQNHGVRIGEEIEKVAGAGRHGRIAQRVVSEWRFAKHINPE